MGRGVSIKANWKLECISLSDGVLGGQDTYDSTKRTERFRTGILEETFVYQPDATMVSESTTPPVYPLQVSGNDTDTQSSRWLRWSDEDNVGTKNGGVE